MSQLTLKRRRESTQKLNLFAVVPNLLCELPSDEIEQLLVRADDVLTPLGEHFEVVDGAREQLVIEGELENCEAIGGGMRSGVLKVHGSVGNHLASSMRGGTLYVDGSAKKFACSNLLAGAVEVSQNVGDYAAGAVEPNSKGMRGGTFVVRGNAGRWLATRMRRGTVVVCGDVKEAAFTRMLAGTVVVCGAAKMPLATAMKRGTILLLGESNADMKACVPGFTAAETVELSFLPILIRQLQQYLPVEILPSSARVQRSIGDRADGGQGELIWCSTDQATPPHIATS